MRKYLISEKGTFYKANLHSHSNLSDGKLSPSEMKEEYKKRGYSILATSDHDVLHCNYYLTDEDFLVLTAYEISIRSDDDPTPHAFRKVVDLNLLAKEPHNMTQVGYHPESVAAWIRREKITQEFADNINYAGELRDMHYYVANMNKIIKTANETGYLVTLNHPMWSLMNYNDYANFEGLWAMEVYNHGCAAISGLSDSESVYDDILRTGKNIFAVATDDNHNGAALDAANSDSFGGFIMVKSEKLDYKNIIDALESGDFYASSGPEIHEIYYENGYVYLKTSEAAEICMTTLGRRGARVAKDDGSPVTEAKFKIEPELYGFVRFRVTDRAGKKAWTNAFYVDELMEEAKKRRVILQP